MSAAPQPTDLAPPAEIGSLPLNQVPVAYLDFETTGLYAASGDRVCEVAVLRVEPGRKQPRSLSQLIDPGMAMPALAQSIHHISDDMLEGQPDFAAVLPRIAALLDGAVVVAHNAPFDIGFLHNECHRAGLAVPAHGPVICTLDLSRHVFGLNKCSLAALARRFDIPQDNAHRALDDCRTTRRIFEVFFQSLGGPPLPSAQALLAKVAALRKGGAQRKAIDLRLARAARTGETLDVDYTARNGTGPLVNRRRITVRELRAPYVDALCHLRGDERVFHTRRIVDIIEDSAT